MKERNKLARLLTWLCFGLPLIAFFTIGCLGILLVMPLDILFNNGKRFYEPVWDILVTIKKYQ